jgi:hypothetical protein
MRDFMRGDDGEITEKSPARITNQTVAQNREEVLSGARRFIYPLKHSKYRIAIISSVITLLILMSVIVFSWFLLYRQQSTGDFAYRISQIIPFPIGRIDGHFVRYEEYLFELRHNMHYLVNQENVDFNSEDGQRQLIGLKQQSIEKVEQRVLIKIMAQENGVEVSEQEVDEQIDLIRIQGGVGSESKTLEDTLEDFYGWGLGDLRRVVKDQILKQKLLPVLDTEILPRAENALIDVQNGLDFAEAAAKYSEDELTKDKGGELGYIFRSNTVLPPQLVEKAFSLAEAEVSGELVETLFGFHIVKTIEYRSPDEALIAHILFRFKDITEFIEQQKKDINIDRYIIFAAVPEITEDFSP